MNAKGVTTVSYAACIHESSLGFLQKLFNDRFRRAPIHHFGIDHIVIHIVSSHDATFAKVSRVFVRGTVALAGFRMHKDRSAFRIRVAGGNGGIGKKNHALAGTGPSQTVATWKTIRRVRNNHHVVGCATRGHPPCRQCDLGRKRNDTKI